MFDTSILRWRSLSHKRSDCYRTPATQSEIHISSCFQSWRHLSISHVGADILTRGHLWSCTFFTISGLDGGGKCEWDEFPRWAAHLPWVEGSPPCSCPGTSYPSSSQQSRCPCRTWRWILFGYFAFLHSPVLSLPVAVHWAHSVATIPLVHLRGHR